MSVNSHPPILNLSIWKRILFSGRERSFLSYLPVVRYRTVKRTNIPYRTVEDFPFQLVLHGTVPVSKCLDSTTDFGFLVFFLVDDYFVLNTFSSDSVHIIFHPYQRISVQVSRDYPKLKIWKNPFQILKGYSFSPERAFFSPEIMYVFVYSTCPFLLITFQILFRYLFKTFLFKCIYVRTYIFLGGYEKGGESFLVTFFLFDQYLFLVF